MTDTQTPDPLTVASCVECGEPWPCPTAWSDKRAPHRLAARPAPDSGLREAISVLENYGDHHEWCGDRLLVGRPQRCHCRFLDEMAKLRDLAARPAPESGLTFRTFAETNRARCEAADGFGHPLDGWTLSDWLLAATGEFGEAANVAKKLNRVRDGIPGNNRTPEELAADLADEFADAVIYLDLAAQSQGIDLGSAIASKFNRTSEKIGAPHRLEPNHAD